MQVFSSDQIRFRSPIPESVHGNRRPCRRTQSPLIPRSPDQDQPAVKPATAPKPNQIQSRTRIPESVQDSGACDRQSPPAHSRNQRNPAVRRLKSAGRAARHTLIPVFPSYRIRSRCPIPESVHGNRRFGSGRKPHPSGNGGIPRFFDYRRSVAQSDTHRFQCSPRPESDFGVRFPNQSTKTSNPADGHNPYQSGNGGIPRFSDHDQPAAKPATAPKPDQIQSRRPISELVHR